MLNSKLVSKSAHAIEREFHMLRAIDKCNEQSDKKVPVPKVYFLCEDESVTGEIFYVMEFVDGRAIKRPDIPGIDELTKFQLWDSIMDTISAIHSIDTAKLVQHLPLQHFPQLKKDLQKSDPLTYFQRQIKTLTAVEKMQSKVVAPIPHFEEICLYILTRAPADVAKLTLIHGDCKIDNFLFHPSEPRVLAVLDWELCTFGHPLFDLANFLQNFVLPLAFNKMMLSDSNVTMGKDKPGQDKEVEQLLQLYAKKHGPWTENPRDNPVDLWPVGVVFGFLRICVISQGVAMRAAKGTASSAQAKFIGSLYPTLSDLAVEAISENPGQKL